MCSEKQNTRVCSTCEAEKPLTKDFFYWRSDNQKFRNECKECHKERQLKNKFGITYLEYHILLKSQGYRCEICRSELESSRYTKFAVDHCHKTGKIRGLLCTSCNTALGLLKDSEHRLHSAIKYLQHHSREDIV